MTMNVGFCSDAANTTSRSTITGGIPSTHCFNCGIKSLYREIRECLKIWFSKLFQFVKKKIFFFS
jgi:hypothetical protein